MNDEHLEKGELPFAVCIRDCSILCSEQMNNYPEARHGSSGLEVLTRYL